MILFMVTKTQKTWLRSFGFKYSHVYGNKYVDKVWWMKVSEKSTHLQNAVWTIIPNGTIVNDEEEIYIGIENKHVEIDYRMFPNFESVVKFFEKGKHLKIEKAYKKIEELWG